MYIWKFRDVQSLPAPALPAFIETRNTVGEPVESLIAALLSSIGSDDFMINLMLIINTLSGLDCCSVHEFDVAKQSMRHNYLIGLRRYDRYRKITNGTLPISNEWRNNAGFFIGSYHNLVSRQNNYGVAHMLLKSRDMPASLLRDAGIQDALIICGGARHGQLSIISIPALDSELSGLENQQELYRYLPVIFEAINKHEDFCDLRSLSHLDNPSLNRIEDRLRQRAPELSPREMQVCARIILGMTTSDIANELCVGTESTLSYRKRLYLKLGINNHHQLLSWYLQILQKPNWDNAVIQ